MSCRQRCSMLRRAATTSGVSLHAHDLPGHPLMRAGHHAIGISHMSDQSANALE